MAEGDFHAVNAVDGGIAGRGAAQGRDQGIGDKAHMHQVVLYGFGKVEGDQHPAFADSSKPELRWGSLYDHNVVLKLWFLDWPPQTTPGVGSQGLLPTPLEGPPSVYFEGR
jgi:hypothetical protein